MCFSERFIVCVYLAGILIQNSIVFAQSSGDPCVFHDVMDNVDIVRYADSISGPTCPKIKVNGSWYRFGKTGAGEVITNCPTGNQCGRGNRIWINGSLPGQSDGIFSRVACLKVGSSCCVRTQNVSMKSCGSYFIYNIGHFIPCSTICLAQTTAIVTTNLISAATMITQNTVTISPMTKTYSSEATENDTTIISEQTTAIVTTNPTSTATMITQNTVTTSSMTNTFLTEATEKDTSIQITIIVANTVGVVVIVLALLAVFVIPVLRRRVQQNAPYRKMPQEPSPDVPNLLYSGDTESNM